MASIYETKESRGLSGDRLVLRYVITGASTVDDAADLLYSTSPSSYAYLQRQWNDKSLTPLGGNVWEAEVPYGVGDIPIVNIPGLPSYTSGVGNQSPSAPSTPSDSEVLGPEWSTDYGQSTRKRTKSIKNLGGVRLKTIAEGGGTIAVTPDDFVNAGGSNPYVDGGPNAPGGGILGFDVDSGVAEGVDVPTGSIRKELNIKVPFITMGYSKLLENLNQHVNSEAFLGRAAGEVLFAGAQVQTKDASGTNIRYTFEIIPNVYNEKVGEDIIIPFRRGWDYLEVRYGWYENPDGPAGGPPIKLPEVALVHQVCKYADLNRLFS